MRKARLRKELSRDEVTALASDLRETFLWFCHRTPELASEYLHSFEGRDIESSQCWQS